jgi:TetR/AcrR family transcriptional regulator, cholesterol catabolism regulator
MSDRRKEILDVAEEMFAERGIKATTVRQIGSKAGILSGSLYHHFGSKLDIVDAILSEFNDHVLAGNRQIVESEPDPVERLRKLNRFAFSLIVDYPAAVLMVQNESNYLAEQERFSYLTTMDRNVAGIWIDTLDEGIKQGRFREDIEVRMFYRLVRDVVAGSIRWFKPSRGKKTIQDVADEVIDILLNGIQLPARAKAAGKSGKAKAG